MTDDDWMMKNAPRGEDMPIGITYDYSYGKPSPLQADLPEGWRLTLGPEVYAEAVEAGFRDMSDIAEKIAEDLGERADFLYLRNPEDTIVATWDEGRWWTAEESEAFMLMLKVPTTYAMAEAARIEKLPRWMRRKLK